MKAAIYNTSNGEILRQIESPADHINLQCQEGEEFFLNCPDSATHIINNEPVTIIPEPPEPTPPTEQETIAGLVNAVQRHLDATARTRNYDGILSLCTYATSLDSVFSSEGQAGVEWRDACWRYSYQVMYDVKAGHRMTPTPAELVAELPQINWS
jgi:hypothetical protein